FSDFKIFSACDEFWNGIEEPQFGTDADGVAPDPPFDGNVGRRNSRLVNEFPERQPAGSFSILRTCRDGRTLDFGPMIVRPVPGGVEVLAPAKLNLFLEILGRRPDGYHEIETLMVAVDLYDTLTVADDPTGRITLRCDDPTLPTGRENLVIQAAE